MSALTEQEEFIGRHYDGQVFDYEINRARLCPVEFALTARQMDRLIPAGASVAEIGVGGGFYSELLAKRGCRLHLVDVSARLLEAVSARLEAAGLKDRVVGVDRASATNPNCLSPAQFDAVLLLGPLYHLCAVEDRRRAVGEAARILKPDGLLFAAGINRLAYLRDLFREKPGEILPRREFHERFLRDGNIDPLRAPPIAFAHLTTVAEFRELLTNDFGEMILLGVESFASVWQAELARLDAAESSAWLDLIEQTAATPEGLGVSDHFLFIGKKISGGEIK